MRKAATVAALVAVSLALPAPVLAAERAQIPEKYTWNLADLYPDEAAWTGMLSALARRGRGRVALSATVHCQGQTVATFRGTFVAIDDSR